MGDDPGIGHNSDTVINETAQGQLRSAIQRIERLNAEKDEITEQTKEVYAEIKGNGFSVGIVRKLVALRRKDRARVQEDNALLELYAAAVGDLDLVS